MIALLFSVWLAAAVPEAGWFYTSRIKLDYPGAWSYMIDGPFKTEAHCNRMRDEAIDAAKYVGVLSFDPQKCVERKPS